MYSMTDPRWASLRIGGTRKKIGTHGSQLCCVAEVLRELGIDTDPARLNRWLATHDGYERGTEIDWSALGMHGLELIDASCYHLHEGPLKRILSWLAEELVVLVAVPTWPRWPRRMHWVCVLTYGNADFLIRDPALSPPSQCPMWLLPRYAMPGEGLNDVIRRAVALGVKER